MTLDMAFTGKAAHHSGGIFAGFDWSDGATIMAAVAAALIAAVIAVAGYSIQRKITRRSERADLYGNAIGAVEAYLEGPYRIRRKLADDPGNWFALSSALSDTKTAMSHQQALLEMHAPAEVVTAYRDFVDAAVHEAGPQMTAAWNAEPITSHHEIPLGTGYDRAASDAKRAVLVAAMAADLKAIGTWWRLNR